MGADMEGEKDKCGGWMADPSSGLPVAPLPMAVKSAVSWNPGVKGFWNPQGTSVGRCEANRPRVCTCWRQRGPESQPHLTVWESASLHPQISLTYVSHEGHWAGTVPIPWPDTYSQLPVHTPEHPSILCVLFPIFFQL